jgi:hypothetical protein
MSAVYNYFETHDILDGIETHPAWFGSITGLAADKLLRGKDPFVFLLRKGESTQKVNERHYYVTFMKADGSIMHQPFVIILEPEGYYYENTSPGGPFNHETIMDILPPIMHAEGQVITPFVK